MPFLAIRPIFGGSGGYVKWLENEIRYLLSPRVFLVEEIFSPRENLAETGYRIHLRIGESLKNEWTRFLNNGLTSYIISAVEEGVLKDIPKLSNERKIMEEISKNPNGGWKVELNRKNNKFEDALSYFETYFLEPIEKLFEDRVVSQHDELLLNKVKYITKKLKSGNIEACKKYLQWVEVKHFVENPERYREIKNLLKKK